MLPPQSTLIPSSNTGTKYFPPCKTYALPGLRLQGTEGTSTFPFGSSPPPAWGLAAVLGVTLVGREFYFSPPPMLIQIYFQNLPKSLFFFRFFFSCTRTEEAEGILDPQESEKLNFNEKCTRSPLLSQLWATAVLRSLSG